MLSPSSDPQLIPPYLADSTTYYVVATDLQGAYTYTNQLFINRFSFIHDTFIGQPFDVTVHPEDVQRCNEAAYTCIMHPGTKVKVEMRKADTEASVPSLWTQWEFSLLQTPDGKPAGILCIGHDITTAKKTFSELQQLRDQYKAILDSKSEAIVLLNPDHQILAFNRAAAKMVLAQSQKHLTEGHLFSSFLPPERVAQFHQGIAMALQSQPFSLTETLPFPSGQAHWFEVSFMPARAGDGGIFGVTCTFRDINAHKIAEEQVHLLSMVATRTSNAVVITDANRNITWVNEGFTRITGYTLEEAKGKNPGRILQCADTNRETILDMRRHLHAGLAYRCEILNRSKQGQLYWLDIEIQPIFDNQLKITGFMAVESDITAYKIAESKILEQNEKLRQIAFEQSHILRKPVSSIMGLCEVIRHELSHNNHTKLEQYVALLLQAAEETDRVVHTIVEKTHETNL